MKLVYVALVVLVAMVIWQMVIPRMGVASITPADLQARLERKEKLMIVDVREQWEYEQGHIKGARLMPLGTLPAGAQGLPKDAPIVLVCRSGNRSAQAYQTLKKQGYTNLLNMSGGMLQWSGPTVR